MFFPGTLNLRGSDIEYNPVFFSYLVITQEEVKLFWADGHLPEDVKNHFKTEDLGTIETLPYGEIERYLESRAVSYSHVGD